MDLNHYRHETNEFQLFYHYPCSSWFCYLLVYCRNDSCRLISLTHLSFIVFLSPYVRTDVLMY